MKRGDERARVFRVRGRVQGVGFRYYVEHAATELGLTGYVKNLDDGRVEVYATGSDQALVELERRLWKGPGLADVRGVDVEEATVRRDKSFRVAPSW